MIHTRTHTHTHTHTHTKESSGRVLKTTAISIRDKEFVKGPWKKQSVEPQASLLHPLPLPCGGVLVVGYETIGYYNQDMKYSIDPPTIKVGA